LCCPLLFVLIRFASVSVSAFVGFLFQARAMSLF
jgi:hypothetical protein